MQPLQHLNLTVRNNSVGIQSSASIVALIYSSNCASCPLAFEEMQRVLAQYSCNFYLINADKEPLVKRLVNKVPSIVGFKNTIVVGKLDGPINAFSIYDFWQHVVSFNTPSPNTLQQYQQAIQEQAIQAPQSAPTPQAPQSKPQDMISTSNPFDNQYKLYSF